MVLDSLTFFILEKKNQTPRNQQEHDNYQLVIFQRKIVRITFCQVKKQSSTYPSSFKINLAFSFTLSSTILNN